MCSPARHSSTGTRVPVQGTKRVWAVPRARPIGAAGLANGLARGGVRWCRVVGAPTNQKTKDAEEATNALYG